MGSTLYILSEGFDILFGPVLRTPRATFPSGFTWSLTRDGRGYWGTIAVRNVILRVKVWMVDVRLIREASLLYDGYMLNGTFVYWLM